MATQDPLLVAKAAARAAASNPDPTAAVFGRYPAAGTRQPIPATQFGPGSAGTPGAEAGTGIFPQTPSPGPDLATRQGYTLGAAPGAAAAPAFLPSNAPSNAGAGRGLVNPAAAVPALPPPVIGAPGSPDVGSPAAADLAAAAPPQVGTAGNIIVDGTNAAGKPNSFSGANVGYGAAYATPDGASTSVNGQTGIGPDAALLAAARVGGSAPAPTGAPTPLSAVTSVNSAPGTPAGGAAPAAVAQQTGTATAGLPQPVGAPGAAGTAPQAQSSQIPFGLSPQEQASQNLSAPARAAAAAPDTTGAVSRANAIQDQQVQLAQQALQLASTGNLSDAIMAKHIRSTIAALGGASTAGASAVNPLLNAQQQAATTERDTDVAASSSRYSSNLSAATQVRQQNVESYFKQPAHVQAIVMAQLQARAAAGDQAALATMRDISAAQDKSQTPVLDAAGAVRAVVQGGRILQTPYYEPGAPAIGPDAVRQRMQGLVVPGTQ